MAESSEKKDSSLKWIIIAVVVIFILLPMLRQMGGIAGVIGGAITGVSPVVGPSENGPYGAHYSPYGYNPYPGDVGGASTSRTFVEEHPPGTPDQYRCDAATGKPANPGNAWCDHTPRR